MKMNTHSEPGIEYANYFRSYVASILVAVFALSACGSQDEAGLIERGPSTAYDANGIKLGSVRLDNSCIDDAQPLLVRGLALLHHMTYEEAREAFSSAAEIDSDCAIAYWGSAMTYVHPLWPDTILSDSQIAGQALLDQARSATHSSTREVAYIDALEAYYGTEGAERDRLAAFLDGWTRVREEYPDDVEGELFYALALMATASAADKTYTLQREAGAIAEAVKAEITDHPGAHHYIIHAYDVPPLAEDALETAYAYDDVASGNSHALHMTTHIFTRLGLWDDSTTFNVRAADAAAERLPSGEISLHHMHALDYLAYAALQQVNDEQAVDVLDHLRSLEPPYQNHAATSYTFAAVPVRLSLERRDWEAAAELEPRWPQEVPWAQYPHLVAIVEFGRALGAAHTGDTNQAEASIAALGVLREAASVLDVAYDWETQVAIQELSARAWLAFVQGDIATALDSMRMAAEMEAGTDKNPVTPGPVLPAQELYGDMLLETGDFSAARRAYEAALSQSPGRMLSLYGAGRAAELAGDLAVAGGFYRQLVENCPNPTVNLPQLEHAQAFLKADA